MHDLIHDLAMKVAGNDCCYLDSETKRLVESPMHVMLERGDIGLLESLDASSLCTLIVVSNIEMIWNGKELSIISKFKYLRVLKLEHCCLSKFYDSIVKLKHLRYLNLRWCKGVRSVFESITSIVCLQTLILERNRNVEFSIKDVSNLINLRHLNIDNVNSFKEKNTTCRFGKLCVGKVCKSVIFSDWHSSLTNIVEISLIRCQSLQYLPPMERLPFLKSLDIIFLHNLECIYYEEPILPESFFPSLEKLNIWKCGKLKGWWRMRHDVNDYNSSQSHHLSLPPFSSLLSILKIIDCSMLTCMPTFPNLDKKLSLVCTCVETLEATLNMVGSKHLIEFPPLSMLKYLSLAGERLDLKKLPKDWLQNLTALDHLEFWWLPSQTFQEIEIWFKEDPNYLPSLRNISFGMCLDLKALPDWICKLSSLEQVKIEGCENLASLPEGMPCLSKLQTLEIFHCPLLLEQCETQTSATWPKIAHIPNIILKRFSL